MIQKEYLRWKDIVEENIKKYPNLVKKISKYSNLKSALKDAKRYRLDEEKINKVKELGILRGELTLEDLEEAERLMNEIRRVYKGEQSNTGKASDNLYDIVNKHLHPVKDADLRAVVLFCNPKVREIFGDRLDTLYRAELISHSKSGSREKRQIYSPLVDVDYNYEGVNSLLGPLDDVIRSIPKEEFSGNAEYQRRLRQIIQKKAERETFKFFKENPEKVFNFIKNYLRKEENKNVKDVYKKLGEAYKGYSEIELKDVNPNFKDPKTGKKGVLPSLHQKIGVYHTVEEGRFGIFDDCGTGKTAIAALTKPLIEDRLRKKGKKVHGRAIVICPYQAIEAWEKGLAGNDSERYFNKIQNIKIINGNLKGKKDFINELKTKDWVIVNYEQLPTKVKTNGEEKTLAEVLNEIGFDYTILDEVHEIKSKRVITRGGDKREPQLTYSAAARIMALQKDEQGEFKPLCALSGTPIPDNMNDYAIPYHLLMPQKCPDPKNFEELYEKNPRILYTFTTEKTLRRKSGDITDLLDPDEDYIDLELDPVQRKIHDYIITNRPENYNNERIKALVDPRLVDPLILKDIGLLGKMSIENSAKYKKLEEILLSEDGPIAKGEKVVIFSSSFKKGITREHKDLKDRYISLGFGKEYETLELGKSLKCRLEEKLSEKFKENCKIEILDGQVSPFRKKNKSSERDEVLERFRTDPKSKILLCTTDTGGQSLDLSNATYAIHLDEDYSPAVTEQANARLSRIGQNKLVTIMYLRGKDTLDTLITQYVNKKGLIIKMAMDGYPLTPEEEALFKDSKHKRLDDLVKRNIGGLPIDLSEANITGPDAFEARIVIPRNSGTRHFGTINYETTAAQEIRRKIWEDPLRCWFNPEFVELYNKTVNNLAVYVMHRAKICDLLNRAKRREIVFPKTVLSDGSGPSLLYNAYQTLAELIRLNGFGVPIVTDRDFSQLMLDKGNNPNKILGNMTGKNSNITSGIFDMVDNESITLLKNDSEVKDCLIEESRIIKPKGLVELVTKSWKFKDSFYTGMEKLGFNILSKRNEGFKANRSFYKYLKNNLGEHYADAYVNKLDYTYLLLAQKIDNPDLTVKSENFRFEPVDGTNGNSTILSPSEQKIVKEFVKPDKQIEHAIPRETFRPVTEIKVDGFGNVISHKKLDKNKK